LIFVIWTIGIVVEITNKSTVYSSLTRAVFFISGFLTVYVTVAYLVWIITIHLSRSAVRVATGFLVDVASLV